MAFFLFLLAETIQSPETESPWRAPNTVFISHDPAANMFAAETFGIEEWHFWFLFGKCGVVAVIVVVVVVVA